jgi:hypothetical protein
VVEPLEQDIARWRSFVERGPAVQDRDVEELEAHLRDQIADLTAAGLAPDEAFLVAVKRMGAVDDLSREFAREHSGRMWQQLEPTAETVDAGPWQEVLAFAVAAAVVARVAGFAVEATDGDAWLMRNVGLLVLPFLGAWFARRRGLGARGWVLAAVPFVAAAVVANAYPFEEPSDTQGLLAAHLLVVLWFALAFPYAAGDLRSHERRMDFVRFTGEWLIYYVLIALGGGVLVGLTTLILEPAGLRDDVVAEWVVPSGAAGAVVVAAWLVEAKQRVIENMAPVLTMVFTPLFAVMLVASVLVYGVTGPTRAFDRELLGVFDALMVVVLGLVLYGISARDPGRPPGWADRTQLVAVVGALLLDVMVLASMAVRIGDLGLTPNRVAALGLNLVLLVNLAVSAWRSVRFLQGRGTFHQLERWHTGYLPVFAVWAAVVVVVLPPAFGFD